MLRRRSRRGWLLLGWLGVGTAVGAGVGVVVGESELPQPTRPARTAVDARTTKRAFFDAMKPLNAKEMSLAVRKNEAQSGKGATRR